METKLSLTCSNDAFSHFCVVADDRTVFFFNLFRKMLSRCGFTVCFFFFSFFTPHRDLIKKFLVIDRARRLGNMKVSLISLSDPYFIPLVGSLLSKGVEAPHGSNKSTAEIYGPLLWTFPQPAGQTSACGCLLFGFRPSKYLNVGHPSWQRNARFSRQHKIVFMTPIVGSNQ